MRYTLRDILANVNGSSFIGIDTETKVTLKGGKKNEQQGRVTKRTIGANVMVFTNEATNGYDSMVKNRLLKEGKDPESFKLGERKWGTRVPNLPIIEHTKDGVLKEYLEVIFLSAGTTQYFLDGELVDKSEIQGLEEKPEVVESENVQGGLKNLVVIRTYDAESIINLRIDGSEFRFKS